MHAWNDTTFTFFSSLDLKGCLWLVNVGLFVLLSMDEDEDEDKGGKKTNDAGLWSPPESRFLIRVVLNGALGE